MTEKFRPPPSKLAWLLCCVAITLVAATPTPEPTPLPEAPASSVTPLKWSEPLQLSTTGQSSWFPDVFADAAGTVHVVWSTGVSTGPRAVFDAVLYRSSQDGVNWTEAVDIAAIPTKGSVTRASILVDLQGLFHFTYKSYTVYYSRAPVLAIKPQNMLPPYEISSPDVGYFSRIAVDSQGRLHIIHSENVFDSNCNQCFHFFHRWSDDNGQTWSAPIDVSGGPSGAAKPWLLIDAQDNLHLIWEVGRGGDLGQVPEPARVAYRVSYDRGTAWSNVVDFVPTEEGQGRLATIGMDGQGTLVAAWLAIPEDRVYFRTSKDLGQTWSDPQIIPGVWGQWDIYQAKLDTYSMAADSQGHLHMVMVGRTNETQKSLSVMGLVWNGEAWSRPGIVTTIEGDVPEWPRLSIGNGNQLNLVWFRRNKAGIFKSDEGQYSIWYARAEAEASNVPAIIFPTYTPDPAITPTAESAPSETQPAAAPTRLVINQGEPIKVYTEANYLMIALQSMLPVVALVVIVVIAAVRMRSRR